MIKDASGLLGAIVRSGGAQTSLVRSRLRQWLDELPPKTHVTVVEEWGRKLGAKAVQSAEQPYSK